MVGSFLKLLD
ncbi:Protein of unknown function [Bacillus cereus]|nr:Protein of unknown function [Bacillus cereus]SCN30931.1 Protein of unknown function [Bacillus wiedmannii]SCN31011.1 Protein of unknown function [Bacillus cereus]